MTLKKYATGWYLCTGCKNTVEPDDATIFEQRQEVYCVKCVEKGEHIETINKGN